MRYYLFRRFWEEKLSQFKLLNQVEGLIDANEFGEIDFLALFYDRRDKSQAV